MSQTRTRIAVVICSIGRPDSLQSLLPHLTGQTKPADRVLFAVTKPQDIGFDPARVFSEPTVAEMVISPVGLPRQRNAALDHLMADCDVVVFFDDDFIPSRFALERLHEAFAKWPHVNGITGHIIADGINTEGISIAKAEELVAAYDHQAQAEAKILREGLWGLYGCNMAYRMSAVGETRFDEALPLYGWQEDIDFAHRVPGVRVKSDALSGVHRGTKSGRETAGRRLGYSQLANPWYLWRKGTMSARFAAKMVLRNMLANHIKIISPEPWIDRRARAAGNRRALWEILLGRAHPERILEL